MKSRRGIRSRHECPLCLQLAATAARYALHWKRSHPGLRREPANLLGVSQVSTRTSAAKTDKPILDLSRSSDPGHAAAWMAAALRGARRAGWPKEKINAVLAEMKACDYAGMQAVAHLHFDIQF